jgi:hypothetical protein
VGQIGGYRWVCVGSRPCAPFYLPSFALKIAVIAPILPPFSATLRRIMSAWLGPTPALDSHFFVDGDCQEFVALHWLACLRLVLPPIAIKLMGENKSGNKGENNVDDNKT